MFSVRVREHRETIRPYKPPRAVSARDLYETIIFKTIPGVPVREYEIPKRPTNWSPIDFHRSAIVGLRLRLASLHFAYSTYCHAAARTVFFGKNL